MKITLKKIKVLNFKGLRDFTATFDGDGELRGDNATGKTTLFDAFTWCLYGKDSYGRSDTNFQLKPLDEEGNVIEKLPHEVEILLDVDGSLVNIRREYKEVWQKRRGSKEEVFTGHTTERFWNDVPITDKEFKQKIDMICSEDIFKLITNPTYFLSQQKKEQRQFLMSLVDDVTMADLPEFADLAAHMSGKSAEEYMRELGAKIKRIKAEMEGIPERIDEQKRSMPTAANFEALKNALIGKEKELEQIEAQMENGKRAFEQYNSQRRDLFKQLTDLNVQISKRRDALYSAEMQDYYQSIDKKRKNTIAIEDLESKKAEMQRKAKDLEAQISKLAEDRDVLIAEWKEIKKRTWEGVDDSQFVCPTCKQRLPEDDIAAKVAEMERNYNSETAKLLETNKTNGMAVVEKKKACEKELDKIKEDLQYTEIELTELKTIPIKVIDKPEVDMEFANDPEMQQLKAKKADLDAAIERSDTWDGNADSKALKESKALLQLDINDIRVKLTDEKRIQAAEHRIAELEAQYKTQQAEIAQLEGELDKVDDLKHALINMIEDRINSLFSMVKFRMYEQQINGGEKETCEALVDGVPYSTNLNTAARINAGIDIINAISKHSDVYAPIFIDNRESITSLIDTESQVINLIKDENYKFLTTI